MHEDVPGYSLSMDLAARWPVLADEALLDACNMLRIVVSICCTHLVQCSHCWLETSSWIALISNAPGMPYCQVLSQSMGLLTKLCHCNAIKG